MNHPFCFFLLLATSCAAANLSLPDALQLADGPRVATPESWREKRRPEILRLYETHIFGRRPATSAPITFEVLSVKPDALENLATRKNIRIYLLGKKDGPALDLLLYIPNAAQGPVPAFLGLNFLGNQSVTHEPDVPLTRAWIVPFTGIPGIVANRPTNANRGAQERRWPLATILKRGYAVATACYGDIEADDWERAQSSLLHATRPVDATGAIGAWAFGLSRALDYLEKDPAIDAKRVAVTGHSRLGKTSLWAGAQDERFAVVISSCSGEGGAALARRKLGERITDSVRRNSFWYSPRYRDYADREEALPVDSHYLISLIAPRPVYVSSATEDTGADPEGEFLGLKYAEPVYALFGLRGLDAASIPPLTNPSESTWAIMCAPGNTTSSPPTGHTISISRIATCRSVNAPPRSHRAAGPAAGPFGQSRFSALPTIQTPDTRAPVGSASRSTMKRRPSALPHNALLELKRWNISHASPRD